MWIHFTMRKTNVGPETPPVENHWYTVPMSVGEHHKKGEGGGCLKRHNQPLATHQQHKTHGRRLTF